MADKNEWEELMVTEFPEDAPLEILKAKFSEITSKSFKCTKKLLEFKRDILKFQRNLVVSESHYTGLVSKNNGAAGKGERLDAEERKRMVKGLVNQSKEYGTEGIYEKIELMETKIDYLETIVKHNRLVHDAAMNALNTQININKIRMNDNK